MTKRLSFFVSVFSLVFAGSSFANDFSRSLNTGLSVEANSEAEEVSFTGRVRFEKRFTKVEPTLCTDLPCQRSQPYWSLVIETSDSRFLLNQRIEGVEAPASVNLSGVTLRAGSRVKVWGEAVVGGADFFILLNVKKIALLNNSGWSCRSASEKDPMLLANVWYETSNDQDGTYKMKIQQVQGRVIYQIAYLDHAFLSEMAHEIHFDGASSGVRIDLGIRGEPSAQINLPAILKVTESIPTSGPAPSPTPTKVGEAKSIEMICNRTRLSDS